MRERRREREREGGRKKEGEGRRGREGRGEGGREKEGEGERPLEHPGMLSSSGWPRWDAGAGKVQLLIASPEVNPAEALFWSLSPCFGDFIYLRRHTF